MKDLKAGERAATESADKADIKQSISLYKQQMMEELSAISGGKDPLEAAMEAYDKAETFSEKNRLRMRIEKMLLRQNKEAKPGKGRSEDVKKALSYQAEADAESRDTNERYLKLATAEMIRDDARIRAAKAKIKPYTDEYKQIMAERPDRAEEYRRRNLKYFTAKQILDEQTRVMNQNKKLLGKGSDANIMRIIANNRRLMLETVKKIE